MKIEDYVNNLDDVRSRNSNVFGIVSNPNIINDNKKCVGKVLFMIEIKSKKKISMNDIVEFNPEKIKWRASYPDNLGRVFCLVDPHWCRLFKLDIKINIPVKIQKTVLKNDGEKEYYIDTEFQIMNKKQFFKRRMIELLEDWNYSEVLAVENFNKRFFEHRDYYRALNETAKNYRLPGDFLTSLRGQYNNIRKNIYKEWDQLFIKHCSNEKAEEITFSDIVSSMKKEEKMSNVIPISGMNP